MQVLSQPPQAWGVKLRHSPQSGRNTAEGLAKIKPTSSEAMPKNDTCKAVSEPRIAENKNWGSLILANEETRTDVD